MGNQGVFTILLVEDNAEQALVLTKLLNAVSSTDELRVEHASSLEGGLSASEMLRPNVTFLDLCLPDVDEKEGGWRKVAECIWAPWKDQSRRMFHPPVIVVSGMDDPNFEIELECYAQGAQNYFQKPFAQKFLDQFIGSAKAKNFAAHLISAAGSADLRARHGRQAHG